MAAGAEANTTWEITIQAFDSDLHSTVLGVTNSMAKTQEVKSYIMRKRIVSSMSERVWQNSDSFL